MRQGFGVAIRYSFSGRARERESTLAAGSLLLPPPAKGCSESAGPVGLFRGVWVLLHFDGWCLEPAKTFSFLHSLHPIPQPAPLVRQQRCDDERRLGGGRARCPFPRRRCHPSKRRGNSVLEKMHFGLATLAFSVARVSLMTVLRRSSKNMRPESLNSWPCSSVAADRTKGQCDQQQTAVMNSKPEKRKKGFFTCWIKSKSRRKRSICSGLASAWAWAPRTCTPRSERRLHWQAACGFSADKSRLVYASW